MATWALYATAGFVALVAVYALVVLVFVLRGRREDARALAGFIP